MKKRIILLILVFLFTITAYSENLDTVFKNLVNDFEKSVTSQKVIGIGTFVYADKNVGSSFSNFLIEKLGIEFGKSRLFDPAPREKLDAILEEIKFGMSGLVDDSTAVEPGMLKGLQLLLFGRFFDDGNTVKVFIKLLEIETGIQIAEKEIILQKSDIPTSISIRPDNYNDALFVIDELSEIMSRTDGSLTVKTWTKRGDGGIFKNGEQLVINFYSTKDCYIKIYHIDVNGNMQLIFPNPYYTDNFISGNRIYKIPDSRYPFTFDLGIPFGSEFIKVIASSIQFKDIEESFSVLGKVSTEMASRGLSVASRVEEATEALISYTIIE